MKKKKNWKTTLGGILLAAGSLGAGNCEPVRAIIPAAAAPYLQLAMVAGAIVMGAAAKDAEPENPKQ